ncbi:MAG: LAGLIDADG family homing endonuclease [Candidatus Hodarchaeota archaeon]
MGCSDIPSRARDLVVPSSNPSGGSNSIYEFLDIFELFIIGMKTVDVFTVSRALDQAHVWHKIHNDFICTKKTRVKIPKIGNKVAYLAGVVTGDGNLYRCKRKNGGYRYRVSIVGRRKFSEQVSDLIKDIFHYTPGIYKDKRKNNCYFVNINCAAVYFFFIELEFQSGKKVNLSVPSLITNDAFLFKHYMQGLIDTDGFKERKIVQLKQRDEDFLKELVRLLKKHFDIFSRPPKVNYTKGKPYYYIRFPINRLTTA